MAPLKYKSISCPLALKLSCMKDYPITVEKGTMKVLLKFVNKYARTSMFFLRQENQSGWQSQEVGKQQGSTVSLSPGATILP